MLHIRSTTEEDLSFLASIYTQAYNTLNIGEKWIDESSLELLKHLYRDQPDLFFTAEDEETVVGGIVSLVKPWWDGFHLTDGELFVSPSQQGKGVGTKLIQCMFTVAQEKYNAVSWDTFTHRVYEHPLKWYKSLGFEEISQWVMITGNVEQVLENIKGKNQK